ncbi:SAM-dependent methyltransferase [Alcanivorax sp. N3-2A]|nr:SAM-dependent methyltransferase [Alcanivorax sp. N3-2A]|tara:strand:- start:74424 stop:75536 length:1113 start_codon:yes stop_codon:yes gene_type:complete
MSETLSPFAPLTLRRWPRRRDETLRAWDAADLYLWRSGQQEQRGPATLVVNDQCGALWLSALASGPAWSAGDSWLAWCAAEANARDNGVELPEGGWLWPWRQPPASVDQVLMRVPKENALLEAQLAWLATSLPAGTPIWLAGMDKHLPPKLVPLMQRYLGNGQAGLGWKKARRFQAVAPGGALAPAPEPARVAVSERGWRLQAGPGVFGSQHLDIGARFMLEHLPTGVAGDVADLGCGNGVLGLALAADNPAARVTFCDESALAVESARANAEALFGPSHRHRFHLGNGLDGLQQQFNLIVLNPPFHRGHAVDEQVARTLFRHARRHLAPGGELRVVANRHLRYQRPLAKLFEQVEVIASNSKFLIYRCR